jgi:hypothetical protein
LLAAGLAQTSLHPPALRRDNDVSRTLAVPRYRSWFRRLLLAAIVGALALIAAAQAQATSLTPGDVVVYRVGTGSGALSSGAFPVFLDEYAPNGTLVESVALPTSTSGSNKPLVASGSGSSEGLLTLSGNGEYLIESGYDAALGTAKISETSDTSDPRVIGRVSASGEINTSTALTDAGNANNPRGAASSDGKNLYWSGAGKSTSGGVHFATLGSSTSTLLSTSDTNARAVEIYNGQLYTSSDPTKESINIATVGSGLPSTGGQATTNLPFATAPSEPYAFSLLTLGLGSAPDTIYVADNGTGAVAKYGLLSGKWTKEGSVAVSAVTGVTANDANGVVTIFATTSGSSGEGGVLYKITDASGVNGTLSGTATQIATAPANEAFRGVAFAPGTTIGSGGGTPPPPAPTMSEGSLPAALEDPTNATDTIAVADEGVAPGELSVKVHSSNTKVAPEAGISVEGSGAQRTLRVTPGAVGRSTITLTVEAPGGGSASTSVEYGVSAYQGDESDRYYSTAGNGSTAIDVGGGYMIVGDDESNVLRLYHERVSGPPVKEFDFTGKLPDGTAEIDIESSARAGDTLYWMGSMSNSKSGKLDPERNIVFAATISGSGASTELSYVGSYTHLRSDMISWDQENGNPLGLKASTEEGVESDEAAGFNVEGLEFAAGSTSTAYVAFRAPQEPTNSRTKALLVPVTNFASLLSGASKATFGTPLEWSLGGRGIREIRKNADNEYLVIAGTSDESNSSFGLYKWDGNPSDAPVLTNTSLSAVNEGAWETIVSVPDPLVSGASVELLEDNGDSEWYGDGLTSKTGLPEGLQKDLGRLFTVQLATPATPGTPQLASGSTPNDNGVFTLSWEASPSLPGLTYTLQHENASGVWSTVASGLTSPEYAFTAGTPEGEGTWSYRVIANGEGGESAPSSASSPIVVDESAPNAPTASADRAPDFAGKGGWYKDTVTVSFAANGDPLLSDGSAGSGVNPATVPAPQTFTTDGAHEASGAVADFAGNVSAASSLTVQVDATPPSVQVSCPATADVGQSGVQATVTASDGQSGLATDPSGTVPIDTSKAGSVTVERTAVDNVGHATSSSCTTVVGFTLLVEGALKKKLIVKDGEAVELTATAKTKAIEVQPGGLLDVEGASTGGIKSSGAEAIRICGATVANATKIAGTTGSVVVGDEAGCAPSTFNAGMTVTANGGDVTVIGDQLKAKLTVTNNTGQATTVTHDTVGKTLTVTGNTGTVIDSPNSAAKTKTQAKKLAKKPAVKKAAKTKK